MTSILRTPNWIYNAPKNLYENQVKIVKGVLSATKSVIAISLGIYDDYDEETTYSQGDFVKDPSDSEKHYVSKVDSNLGNSLDDTDYWKEWSGTGSGDGATYSEVWKKFSGDGSTTDFDCETSVSRVMVVLNGSTLSTDDYDKDNTVIKFNSAPEDGAEIRCWILEKD